MAVKHRCEERKTERQEKKGRSKGTEGGKDPDGRIDRRNEG